MAFSWFQIIVGAILMFLGFEVSQITRSPTVRGMAAGIIIIGAVLVIAGADLISLP